MQTNNVTDVWGTPVKVNSLQDIAKLPIIKTEVQEKPEVQTQTKIEPPKGRKNANPQLNAAVIFSLAHPEYTVVEVAAKFGVSTQGLYDKRHRMMKRATKVQAKAQPKKVVAVMTSAASIKETKQDVVNHPAHYKTGGIETIDFIEAKKLTYNLGNVVKYITRAGVKNKATHIEDLEKAAWYLNREIANLKGGA